MFTVKRKIKIKYIIYNIFKSHNLLYVTRCSTWKGRFAEVKI